MRFKHANSIILMIGERKDECGGSVYYDLFDELGANLPKPNLAEAENQIFALTDATDDGLILAAHDISDGGIAVALAEMSFGNEIGFKVNIPGNLRADKKLFSETCGFVLEAAGDKVNLVKNIFKNRGIEVFEIGRTISDFRFQISDLIEIDGSKAKDAWLNGLRDKLY